MLSHIDDHDHFHKVFRIRESKLNFIKYRTGLPGMTFRTLLHSVYRQGSFASSGAGTITFSVLAIAISLLLVIITIAAQHLLHRKVHRKCRQRIGAFTLLLYSSQSWFNIYLSLRFKVEDAYTKLLSETIVELRKQASPSDSVEGLL